jgi:hypothetical protein
VGRFLRPKAEVLPDSALIPKRNLIEPPPNRFTHEITAAQPYYYDATETRKADGTFEAGTKVLLLAHDGGSLCLVVDGRGLYVATPFVGLAALPAG